MKIAHVTWRDGEGVVQDLKEHLLHTATLCSEYMREMGCPAMGYLAGLLHDLGKAAETFQARMRAILAGAPDPGQKGGHAAVGAAFLNGLQVREDSTARQFAIQAISEAVCSHHAALPDNVTPEGQDGYTARLQCDEVVLREAEQYFWTEILSQEAFGELLRQAYTEAEELLARVGKHTGEKREFRFFLGLAEKMLLSALIDADWLDSALSEERGTYDFDDIRREEAGQETERKELFRYFLSHLENTLEKKRSDRPINRWRDFISLSCKKAGDRTSGIYTLSCPTGAGKTLAVTRFALNHSILRGKERIFYISPYLSIIDQTAKSIREALSGESREQDGERAMARAYQEAGGAGKADEIVEENILELHSQAENNGSRSARGTGEKACAEPSADDEYDGFWAERMAEPLVLTTMVRFLNTFFAQGTRNLRPAHRFQKAVIIFDEIQTLSIRHIALFNSLLNFLTEICDCTCVLCSATQPLLGETEKPVYPLRMAEPAALAVLPPEAGNVFRRVQVEAALRKNGYTAEELGEFIYTRGEECGNVLAVFNTKAAALNVYRQVVMKAEEYQVFYLSTWLYPAHRKERIAAIRDALEHQRKIIVVSTQLIEAGIDFDFSCVIRSLAGMDSIVQAAGRCNREGRREGEKTYLVNPCGELESLTQLRDIRTGAQVTERRLREYEREPGIYENDLLSEKMMHAYFEEYFWKRREEMSYLLPGRDDCSLYDLLADNRSMVTSAADHMGYSRKTLDQSFRSAAEAFRAIEESGEAVLVTRGRGKEIWEEAQKNADYKKRKGLMKEAQQYVLNLRKNELKKAGQGVIHWDDKLNMYFLNEMYYDEKTGFTGEICENMPFYDF